jgi:large subunit ribosomal protein L17
MRHRIAGRKLGRTGAHRLATLRNLSGALIEHERIRTTLAKAKEVRRFTEKLVTIAKRETLHARRTALKQIPDRKAVAKLFDTLSARYASRPGGYTRILKLGPRRGDNAEMALIEFVASEALGSGPSEEPKAPKKKTKRKAKATKEPAPAKKAKKAKKAKTTKKKAGKKTASRKSSAAEKASTKKSKSTKKKATKKKTTKKRVARGKADKD